MGTRPMTLLLLVTIGISGPGRASAEVPATEVAALVGRTVVLVRTDASSLRVRVVEVVPPRVLVELEDRSRQWVRMSDIARLMPVPAGAPAPTQPPAAKRAVTAVPVPRSAPAPRIDAERPLAPTPARIAPRPSRAPGATPAPAYHFEPFGLRFMAGGAACLDRGDAFERPNCSGTTQLEGMVLHAEVIFVTVVWRRFYWETLRVGGGEPWLGHWGTGFGWVARLDPAGRHTLRLGVHLTFGRGYVGTWSGVQFLYVRRFWDRFAMHLGVQQYSYPPGAALTFGFSP